jgi:hypothetical protein
MARDLEGSRSEGLGSHLGSRHWTMTEVPPVIQTSRKAQMHNRGTVSGDAGAS